MRAAFQQFARTVRLRWFEAGFCTAQESAVQRGGLLRALRDSSAERVAPQSTWLPKGAAEHLVAQRVLSPCSRLPKEGEESRLYLYQASHLRLPCQMSVEQVPCCRH